MRTTTLLLLCIVLCLASSAPGAEWVLVENGQSPCHIVVAVDASVQDFHAAELLQRTIQEMTGAELSIVSDDNALGETEIIVGFNRHVRMLAPHLQRADFGPEEFLLKSIEGRLVIVGGSPRGVLYGVNSLLTEQWGCRWFTAWHRRIPKHDRLAMPSLDVRYEPPFEWRNVEYLSAKDVEWTFHNFAHQEVHRHQAGWAQKGWRRTGPARHCFVHTMPRLVPKETYLKDHPDYFWPREGGPRRSGPSSQANNIGVCVTHPDVARIVGDAILKLRRTVPEGDVWYVLSSADNNDWCECERCQAWLRNELGGSLPPPHPTWGAGANWPYGALWLDFARRVQDVLANHPDSAKVGMLAYGDTPVPPAKPPMHKDLCVVYAAHQQQAFRPLQDPGQVVPRRLAGWVQSAGTVYQWLYTMNFGHWWFMHPTDGFIAKDLRYLRDVGVKGIFAEGNSAVSGRYAGDMSELHGYLWARLMWNPDLDWREERRGFCAAYYGGAAGAVIEDYLDDRHAAFLKSGGPGANGMDEAHFAWIKPSMFERWHAYLDRAEALADTEEHKKEVRVARLAVQFTQAQLVQDPDERKAALHNYVDAVRGLVGNPAISMSQHHDAWARQAGLKW